LTNNIPYSAEKYTRLLTSEHTWVQVIGQVD